MLNWLFKRKPVQEPVQNTNKQSILEGILMCVVHQNGGSLEISNEDIMYVRENRKNISIQCEKTEDDGINIFLEFKQ